MYDKLTDKQIFVRNLQRLIDDRDISQLDLAKAVGVSPAMVTYWTQGKNYPRIEVMQKIAQFFGVP